MSDRPDELGEEHDVGGRAAPPPPRAADRAERVPRVSRRDALKVVIGSVAAIVGLALAYSGLAPLTESRDADGYFMSNPFTVDLPSRAVTSGDVDLLRGRWQTLVEESFLVGFLIADPDDIRMEGVASGPGALFMGIAPTPAVEEYLDGVAHHEISNWDADLANITEIEYTTYEGTTTPAAPGSETFWAASASGAGSLTLDWTIESGEWTTVIMNADAASGVTADIAFGALPQSNFDTLHWASFAVGLVLLVGGGLVVYLGLRRRRRPRPAPR